MIHNVLFPNKGVNKKWALLIKKQEKIMGFKKLGSYII